jgi:hypothetical protein
MSRSLLDFSPEVKAVFGGSLALLFCAAILLGLF